MFMHSPHISRSGWLLFCFLLLCTSRLAHSQQYFLNQVWEQSYANPDNVLHSATTMDTEGHLIMVGNTKVTANDHDVLISKHDREGQLIWETTYAGSGNGNDYGMAVAIDTEGYIYVAALVVSVPNGLPDIVVLKYHPNGSLEWDVIWDGPSELADIPAAIVVNADRIYVCGARQVFQLSSLLEEHT